MSSTKIEVERSDLEKTLDVLMAAARHHTARDDANAALHLAASTRFSPLTSNLLAECDRLKRLLPARGATAQLIGDRS